MNMMIDLIIVVITAILIIGGYKRGLVHSVVELLGTAISAVISSFGASLVSAGIYQAFVKDYIISAIQEALPKTDAAANTAGYTADLMADLPGYMKNSLDMLGISEQSLTDEITAEITATEMNIPVMLESMIRPIVMRLLTVVVTIVLFALVATIISLVIKSVMKAVDVTGLSTTNKVLGAVLGLVEALVIVMVMSLILYFMSVMLPVDAAEELRKAIDSTFIFKTIDSFNIPELIMSKLISF
ncbi:MAG: CvpA family protein [Clostridia bacterium]|nr:CvpA family protein [Clostridia bacterium]